MEFRDLKMQYKQLKSKIDANIIKVISSANFIGGELIETLEHELAAYVGVRHCITCANGTDALSIALLTWGIGPGDAVFVPDFTFFSSGECPAAIGSTPVFVDVNKDDYNINPEALEVAIKKVIKDGKYRARAVIAVDLFGIPADYDAILPLCKKYNLLLLEDGAQGFGGELNGKRACSFGDISTTSFFPAKPLGCYGDGGAIFTNNDEWDGLIRSIAVHGKSKDNKYDNIRIGMNSRLDTIQAAVLLTKLEAFKKYELDNVNRVADWYNSALKGCDIVLPDIKEGVLSSWAQYTVQLPSGTDREHLQKKLRLKGIPSMIYYMKPMHLQEAFGGTDSATAICPVTEELCKTVLSLPMHPYLQKSDVEEIAEAVKGGLEHMG